MSAHLLVVDDEQSILDFLQMMLEEESYQVTTADSVSAARTALANDSFDMVLCDIMMPDGSGLDLLQEISKTDSRACVIMMTAYTSTRNAIEAMKLGAHDYLSKPFDVDELKVVVERALEQNKLVEENEYLRDELRERYARSSIIGRSRKMLDIFDLVERIAATPSTVLIQGESGTGKELIARAIHYASPRSERRFLSINCGALPENLLESELFGHERGAFTGAVKEKKGLFQEADQGTLFLDEIGDTSLTMQVKLLRALQDKKVRKVGGTAEQEVDVRIIAATNQDLKQHIDDGTFREDLYYRINVIPIQVPPLRQRREDIPPLVEHFLDKFAERMDLPPKRISVEAMRLLESYEWPGNVRQLENLIERSIALSGEEVITARDIPLEIVRGSESDGQVTELPADGLDLEAHLTDIRRDLMAQALERSGGVQTQAAELLGMSFRSFRYYAKKLGLAPGDETDVREVRAAERGSS
ncbi:MAG: sigma-54 dependent transcriptional regulator [Thermoanaerobaculia bacterium]|nr:sigma-54 dependent transcriptional regulator [Thermoanaerobaculia bacterium]